MRLYYLSDTYFKAFKSAFDILISIYFSKYPIIPIEKISTPATENAKKKKK